MGHLRILSIVVVCSLAAAAPAFAQDPPPEPPPAVIADGVSVAGVDVGGLTADEATAAVQAFFAQRAILALGSKSLSVSPSTLGARARVAEAVAAALLAPVDAALPLRVSISGRALSRWVKRRAKAFRRKPVSARITLTGVTPRIVDSRPGRSLVRSTARRRLRSALLANRRAVTLPVHSLRPAIRPGNVGPAVVIRRGSRRLTLFRDSAPGKMRAVASFPVAVGMPAYPTPLGSFRIRTMTRNPWWYPPDRPWAAGAQPVPPGPGNPLGTRWMGLNVGGVGIHGTPNSGSVGSAASHGCIRMYISSAEWLFARVRVGTPVFIVAS